MQNHYKGALCCLLFSGIFGWSCGESEAARKAKAVKACQQDSVCNLSDLSFVGFAAAELDSIRWTRYAATGDSLETQLLKVDSFAQIRQQQSPENCLPVSCQPFLFVRLSETIRVQVGSNPPFVLSDFQKAVFSGRTMTHTEYYCALAGCKLNGVETGSNHQIVLKKPNTCAEQ